MEDALHRVLWQGSFSIVTSELDNKYLGLHSKYFLFIDVWLVRRTNEMCDLKWRCDPLFPS